MATQAQIQIAAKLYDARTTLIRLAPELYPERIKQWQDQVRKAMAIRKLDVLPAAIWLAHEMKSDGMAQLWILAAAIEIIEPLETLAP